MTDLIHASKAAVLLSKTGIGPVTVAVVYTAWSHAARVRSEAVFAALAGVNPIPASSETPSATDSIAVATGGSTVPCRWPSSPG